MVLNDSDADGEGEYIGRRGNGEGEEESGTYGRPPLPRTWLENVARAVLLGGAGTHIGAPSRSSPSHSQPQSPRSRLDSLRISPSLSTKPTLPDQINAPNPLVSKGRAPPFLCAQVAARRTPSETRVSRTRVVCRSAPGSRSGSRVRGMDSDLDMKSRVDRGKEKGMMKGKEKHKARKAEKGKGKEKYGVPSLARTKAQNDVWANLRGGEMYTSSSDDEDEEGELDLARLLVPLKGQNSIQSLRRHLHGALPPQFIQGITSSASSSVRGGTRSNTEGVIYRGRRSEPRKEGKGQDYRDAEGEDEHWRRVMMTTERNSLRARHRKVIRDEGEILEGFFSGEDSTGSRAGSKRRRGIYGVWATGS